MGRKLCAEVQAEARLKNPNKPWDRYKEAVFIRLSSRYDRESCKNKEKQVTDKMKERAGWKE